MIDQTLFGEQSDPPRDTSNIVAELKQQYTSWKHVDGTHWQARFHHLVNYGAGMPEFWSNLSVGSMSSEDMFMLGGTGHGSV